MWGKPIAFEDFQSSWEYVAKYIGGSLVLGEKPLDSVIVYQHHHWQMQLYVYERYDGWEKQIVTRIQVPVSLKYPFDFHIYNRNLFPTLIYPTDLPFIHLASILDTEIAVKSNNKTYIQQLIDYKNVKDLLLAYEDFQFLFFDPSTDKASLKVERNVYFEVLGFEADSTKLFQLFQFFTYVLDGLLDLYVINDNN